MTILASTMLLTTLMLTAPTVYAGAGSPSPPDLTIDEFGIDEDGNPFLTVEGTAGGTIPDEKDEGDIYAHVFVTDKGVFVVAAHPGFADSNEQPPQEAWHGHGLELTEDQPPCIVENSINDDGEAVVEGKTVTLDTSDLDEEDRPTEVESVLTAVLSAETKGGICVVKVFSEG